MYYRPNSTNHLTRNFPARDISYGLRDEWHAYRWQKSLRPPRTIQTLQCWWHRLLLQLHFHLQPDLKWPVTSRSLAEDSHRAGTSRRLERRLDLPENLRESGLSIQVNVFEILLRVPPAPEGIELSLASPLPDASMVPPSRMSRSLQTICSLPALANSMLPLSVNPLCDVRVVDPKSIPEKHGNRNTTVCTYSFVV